MKEAPEAAALTIERLSFAYDGAAGASALEEVSLSIADNEFTAIIGQNGAGKTTLLKNMTGLLRPRAGDVFIRGRNAKGMSVAAISEEAGFVMQNPDRQLFADTVYDEAAFALRNRGLSEGEIKPRVEAALEAVGLAQARGSFPLALDRGERARVVIASVLAMGSRILIFDEPAAGQDFRNSRRIMDILRELHGAGYTIVFVTHTMYLVSEYARRVIVMKEKRLVMDGTAADVFGRAGELAAAGILPPQITRLGRELLRVGIPLRKDPLSAAELGDMLLPLKRGGGGAAGA